MTIAPRPGGRSSPPRREVSAGRPAAAPSLQPVSSAASPPASRRGPLIQGVSKRGRLGQRSSAEAPPPPSSAKAPGRLLSGTLTSHSLLAATRFSARPLWERGSPVAGGGGSPSSRFVAAFRARPSFLPPPASSWANSSTLGLVLSLHCFCLLHVVHLCTLMLDFGALSRAFLERKLGRVICSWDSAMTCFAAFRTAGGGWNAEFGRLAQRYPALTALFTCWTRPQEGRG